MYAVYCGWSINLSHDAKGNEIWFISKNRDYNAPPMSYRFGSKSDAIAFIDGE